MKQKRFTSQLNDAIRDIERLVREQGNLYSQNMVQGAYSQESLPTFQSNFEHETRGAREELASILRDIDPEFRDAELSQEAFSESLRAGLIAHVAAQDPASYHQSALRNSREGAMSLESLASGIGGELDVASIDDYSQESFDNTQLANFAAQNIAYNVLASRQNEFAEAFFPTKVVTPSEGGIEVTVDRQEVIDYAQHEKSGTSRLGVNRRNLMDAFMESDILSKPTTELIPDAENGDSRNFVDSDFVSNKSVTYYGETMSTRPLRIGRRMNFMGLCQHPGLIHNGTLDLTDQIAPGLRLSKIYLGMNDDEAGKEAIRFDVEHMGRNQFKKSWEGRGRDVTLNFVTSTLTIDGETKRVSGGEPTALKSVIHDNDNISLVQLGVSVSGNANLETGEVEINASDVRIEAVYDSNHELIDPADSRWSEVENAISDADARIVGYDLSARRSNSNWRSTGTLIDVTPYTESYAIEPGYPISVLTPTSDQENGQKISGMVNAARIRNSNNAVTTLLNYAEQLSAYRQATRAGAEIDIVGASRHIVKPFYESRTLDMKESVESIRSVDRFQDVSRVMVDNIRDVAYRMYRDSNYCSALDLATSGTNTKPIVLIGTDNVIARYLNVEGEAGGLLGESVDYRIVSTADKRVRNRIFMTFTREAPGSEDGLSFGVHAFIPELIQRVTTQRQGSTAQNDRVIPRSIHVPVLPVLAEIEIENLSEALINME